jgi:drug/metabolite transporter (DMT)-like permease
MSMSASPPPIDDRRLFGIGLVLLGYAGFTGIDTSAKYLAAHGIPTFEIVFVRHIVQLLLIVAIFMPSRGMTLFRSNSLPLNFGRAMGLLGSSVFNFLAVSYLPLTVTGSIMFLQPLLLVALSIPMLGEKVGWRRWLAIVVGFIGILIIVRPGSATFHPAVGLSLLAATSGAFYLLFTRRLATIDTVATQQFYAPLICAVIVAPLALTNWVWPSDPGTWFAFAMIGVFGMVGHQLATAAHRLAPASVLAPFGYSQIITLSLTSWLIFAQPPSIWLYIGGPIVIGSGLYIWLRERELGKRTPEAGETAA